MYYGDSDAGSQVEDSDSEGENPFLEATIPATTAPGKVEVKVEHSGSGGQGQGRGQPAAASMQGRFQEFPSNKQAAISFPTITGSGSTSFGDTAAAVLPRLRGVTRSGSSLNDDTDVTMSEVETEGETETENEDSDSEAGGKGEPPRGDWSNNTEEDWIKLVEHQLNRASVGRPDAHAMRHMLRKAGFIPASLRKDVWRLLILGRVEAAAVGGGAAKDALALDAAILSTELDLENQRVVRVDVERTRPALDQFKRPRVKSMLARVLTHHCKTHGLGYKQVRRSRRSFCTNINIICWVGLLLLMMTTTNALSVAVAA